MATANKKSPAKKAAKKSKAPKKAAKKKPVVKKEVEQEDPEVKKQREFDKLGVPKKYRGQNLYENDPDMSAAIQRENYQKSQKDISEEAIENTITGDRDEDEGDD